MLAGLLVVLAPHDQLKGYQPRTLDVAFGSVAAYRGLSEWRGGRRRSRSCSNIGELHPQAPDLGGNFGRGSANLVEQAPKLIFDPVEPLELLANLLFPAGHWRRD